jgi:protein TonB
VKQAAPAPIGPVHVSTGVQAAKLVRQVKPVYPPLARQARISGTVRLVAIIGRDGSIKNLQVAGGHPLLTAAAVDAVKQWLYRPTLLNEQPVEVITQIDVNFTLSN